MARKRPCSYCRRWFEPDARTARWQRVCGREVCQRERHARACASWRERNPDYDVERRLRARLAETPDGGPAPPDSDPRDGLREEVARDAMGLKAWVVSRELAGLLVQWTRDALPPKTGVQRGEVVRVRPEGARDETEPGGPSP